jgi:hypothetical protein
MKLKSLFKCIFSLLVFVLLTTITWADSLSVSCSVDKTTVKIGEYAYFSAKASGGE